MLMKRGINFIVQLSCVKNAKNIHPELAAFAGISASLVGNTHPFDFC